jgi:hypothetical protein
MASELSALLDHIACGLLEVRRQLCNPNLLLVEERVGAIEHVKVAYAAIVNLRRIFRRVEQRAGDGASTSSEVLRLRESSSIEYFVGQDVGHGVHHGHVLNHGPTAAEWRAVHDEIKSTDLVWRSLAFDGLQSDGRGGLIEYRRCPHCSSTLGRHISRQEAIEVCRMSAEVHARSLDALAHSPTLAQRRKVARR